MGDVRLTNLYAEALTQNSAADVRITNLFAQILTQNSTADVRLTDLYVEVLGTAAEVYPAFVSSGSVVYAPTVINITHIVTLADDLGAPAGGTTSAIDTTGADCIIISVSYYSALSPTFAVSDSKGNTWIPLTARENVNANRLYYVLGANVGTGHTFTVVKTGGADLYGAVVIHAFSGVGAFGAETGSNTADVMSTSFQPGSLTPANSGALVITGMGVNTVSAVSVNSGLTLTEQPDIGGTCVTGATGWKIQNPAAAINPTWSWTTSDRGGFSLAIFTPAAGASTGVAGAFISSGSTLYPSAEVEVASGFNALSIWP